MREWIDKETGEKIYAILYRDVNHIEELLGFCPKVKIIGVVPLINFGMENQSIIDIDSYVIGKIIGHDIIYSTEKKEEFEKKYRTDWPEEV